MSHTNATKQTDLQPVGTIIVHIVIILLAYSSPWWLDWRLVLAGITLYYLQLLLFGWCILSLRQFGEKKTFHEWYLQKFGFHPDPLRLRWFLNYVIPPLLVLIAVIWQLSFNKSPLLGL